MGSVGNIAFDLVSAVERWKTCSNHLALWLYRRTGMFRHSLKNSAASFDEFIRNFSAMASSDESIPDSDEDLICCHICLLRFNSLERKPKFLDCHHFFCLRCIRAIGKDSSIPCPTCRHVTNMTGREIEDLTTNSMALRLVTIALDRARESAERGKKLKSPLPVVQSPEPDAEEQSVRLWCVECTVLSTPACRRQQHLVCDYAEVFNENMEVLANRANSCCQGWDKAIEERREIHRTYGDVLESLRFLQTDLLHRIDLNDGNVALMESKKQEAIDTTITPGGIRAFANGDIINSMSQINKTMAQLDNWALDASRNQFIAQRLLDKFRNVEENYVQVSINSVRPDGAPLRPVELLQKLQLSFSGAQHDEPLLKASVSVISFLILRLAEEQAKQTGNAGDNPAFLEQFQPPQHNNLAIQLERDDGHSRDVEESEAAIKPTKAPTYRDSLLQASPRSGKDTKAEIKSPSKTVKPPGEWQTVSKPIKSNAGSGKSKCFFRFTIDGVMTDQVVFQLEYAAAPVMSRKFVEMCTGEKGYQGSRLFKNVRGELVMGGSRWFHVKEEGAIRKDLFKADRSEVKEKRGSIRFQMKSMSDGQATVSTEFQVILINRTNYHKNSTVFGHVIEGIAVWDRLSGLNLKDQRVYIAECGVCK